jgi:hypothetical protein
LRLIVSEDIKKLWQVLNPERKVAIQFGDFVRGMLSVAEDSELRKIMSLDRPNRFQLLSLVIDSVRSRFVCPTSSSSA